MGNKSTDKNRKTLFEEAVTPGLESRSRRNVVKGIASTMTALAAYHVLPVKWGTPVIEQVFLPAHAQTSAMVQGNFGGNVTVTITSNTQTAPERRDFFAHLGNSLGNFLVSDAQAISSTVNQTWCVSISGTTATWFGITSMASGTVHVSGSVTGTTEYDDTDAYYYLRIVDFTTDSIQIEVRVVYHATETFIGTAWLARTSGSCSLPA